MSSNSRERYICIERFGGVDTRLSAIPLTQITMKSLISMNRDQLTQGNVTG